MAVLLLGMRVRRRSATRSPAPSTTPTRSSAAAPARPSSGSGGRDPRRTAPPPARPPRPLGPLRRPDRHRARRPGAVPRPAPGARGHPARKLEAMLALVRATELDARSQDDLLHRQLSALEGRPRPEPTARPPPAHRADLPARPRRSPRSTARGREFRSASSSRRLRDAGRHTRAETRPRSPCCESSPACSPTSTSPRPSRPSSTPRRAPSHDRPPRSTTPTASAPSRTAGPPSKKRTLGLVRNRQPLGRRVQLPRLPRLHGPGSRRRSDPRRTRRVPRRATESPFPTPRPRPRARPQDAPARSIAAPGRSCTVQLGPSRTTPGRGELLGDDPRDARPAAAPRGP